MWVIDKVKSFEFCALPKKWGCRQSQTLWTLWIAQKMMVIYKVESFWFCALHKIWSLLTKSNPLNCVHCTKNKGYRQSQILWILCITQKNKGYIQSLILWILCIAQKTKSISLWLYAQLHKNWSFWACGLQSQMLWLNFVHEYSTLLYPLTKQLLKIFKKAHRISL